MECLHEQNITYIQVWGSLFGQDVRVEAPLFVVRDTLHHLITSKVLYGELLRKEIYYIRYNGRCLSSDEVYHPLSFGKTNANPASVIGLTCGSYP